MPLQNNSYNIKSKIINKAIDMFLKIGFKTLTLNEIAAEMSISKRTIYNHFQKKHNLIEIVTIHLFEKKSKEIDKISAMKVNSIEKSLLINAFLVTNFNDERTLSFNQLKKHYPEIYKSYTSCINTKIDECIVEILKKGINQHIYRNNINLKQVSYFYITGIKNIQNTELFNPKQFNIFKVQQTHLEYYLRAICTSKGIECLETIIKRE